MTRDSGDPGDYGISRLPITNCQRSFTASMPCPARELFADHPIPQCHLCFIWYGFAVSDLGDNALPQWGSGVSIPAITNFGNLDPSPLPWYPSTSHFIGNNIVD